MRSRKRSRMVIVSTAVALIVAMLLIGACAKRTPSPTPTTPAPAATPTATPTPSPTPAAPIEIKSICFLPTTHIIASFIPEIVNRVNQACGGQVIWKHLGGPEVIPGLEQFEAVKGGTVDASFLVTAYYFGQVPEAYCANLSKLMPWEERQSGFYDLMNEIHEAAGVHYLGRWHRMGFYIWTKKPVTKLADLKGLKIRGGGVCYDPWFEKLGITGVQIPPPDVYSALQRGLVEGFGWPMLGANDFGWLEIIKNCVDHEVYSSSNALTIINLKKWYSIPKPLRDNISKAFAEAEHDMVKYYSDLYEKERQKAMDTGVTFTKLSPEEARYYVDVAYEADWEFQKAKSDVHYAQLRKALGY